MKFLASPEKASEIQSLAIPKIAINLNEKQSLTC